MDVLIGAMFSFSFIITLVGILVAIFIVTVLIRMFLKKKYINELALAREASNDLRNRLFSSKWDDLNRISRDHMDVQQKKIEQRLDLRFNEIAEVLDSCNVLVASLDEERMEEYEMKEIAHVLSYVNDVIESEKDDVEALNKDIDEILIMTKYTKPTQELKRDTSIHVKEVAPAYEMRKPQIKEKVTQEQGMVKEKEKMEFDNNTENHDSVESYNRISPVNETVSDDVSVLGKGLVIDGNVTSNASLIIKGKINGDVRSGQDVDIDDGAQINGNIKADRLNLQSGKIEGSIASNQDTYIGNETYVKGNIVSANIAVNGSVEGDIQAYDEVSFSSGARVLGDITAMSIDIEKGARIVGTMRIGEQTDTNNTQTRE